MGIFTKKSAAEIRAVMDAITDQQFTANSALSELDAERRTLAVAVHAGDDKARKRLDEVNARRAGVAGNIEELELAREVAQREYDAAAAREAKRDLKADKKRFDGLLAKRLANARKAETSLLALRDALRDMQADRGEILALSEKFAAFLPPDEGRIRPAGDRRILCRPSRDRVCAICRSRRPHGVEGHRTRQGQRPGYPRNRSAQDPGRAGRARHRTCRVARGGAGTDGSTSGCRRGKSDCSADSVGRGQWWRS